MEHSWLFYAIGAAIFAAMINVFGKWGMKDINSDMATAVRSVVQAAFVVGFASITGVMKHISQLHWRASSAVLLSGICGGLSWICAFRAIQLADVSKVAPIDKLSLPLGIVLAVILLHERPSGINWAGIALIVGGAYLATMKG